MEVALRRVVERQAERRVTVRVGLRGRTAAGGIARRIGFRRQSEQKYSERVSAARRIEREAEANRESQTLWSKHSSYSPRLST